MRNAFGGLESHPSPGLARGIYSSLARAQTGITTIRARVEVGNTVRSRDQVGITWEKLLGYGEYSTIQGLEIMGHSRRGRAPWRLMRITCAATSPLSIPDI